MGALANRRHGGCGCGRCRCGRSAGLMPVTFLDVCRLSKTTCCSSAGGHMMWQVSAEHRAALHCQAPPVLPAGQDSCSGATS